MYCQVHLGPLNLSFIWRYFLLCPLYRVSIKERFHCIPVYYRGSTVYSKFTNFTITEVVNIIQV